MLYGVFGTIVSMFVLSFLISMCNEWVFSDDHPSKLNSSECLLLAAVLCATDTVAALTIVKEKDFPVLNSILFGEGVVNDAISILLYRAVEGMIILHNKETAESGGVHDGGKFSIGGSEIWKTFLNFIILCIASVSIGIIFGLLTAYIFKKITTLKDSPVREITIILLMAYTSYIMAELMMLSGNFKVC
jgi:NhaP-type Na+/H+ or K+/H+ antiporter